MSWAAAADSAATLLLCPGTTSIGQHICDKARRGHLLADSVVNNTPADPASSWSHPHPQHFSLLPGHTSTLPPGCVPEPAGALADNIWRLSAWNFYLQQRRETEIESGLRPAARETSFRLDTTILTFKDDADVNCLSLKQKSVVFFLSLSSAFIHKLNWLIVQKETENQC